MLRKVPSHGILPVSLPRMRRRMSSTCFTVAAVLLFFIFLSESNAPFMKSDPARASPPIAPPRQRIVQERLLERRAQIPLSTKLNHLELTPQEELAAVINFVMATPGNSIDNSIDPHEPIPPELLLPFNTRDQDRFRTELENIVQTTWFEHPVILIDKTHSPRLREVRKMVDDYKLLPLPVVIEADLRRDADVFTPVIHRLTNSTSFPVLIVGGLSIGTFAEIKGLHMTGELQTMIQEAGAVVGGSEKKKKRKLIVQLQD